MLQYATVLRQCFPLTLGTPCWEVNTAEVKLQSASTVFETSVYQSPPAGRHLMTFLVPCRMCAIGLTRHADFVSKEVQCREELCL
jgi:hypothetical protein